MYALASMSARARSGSGVETLVIDHKVARRGEQRRQRGIRLVDRRPAGDPIADPRVPVGQEDLRRMRPARGARVPRAASGGAPRRGSCARRSARVRGRPRARDAPGPPRASRTRPCTRPAAGREHSRRPRRPAGPRRSVGPGSARRPRRASSASRRRSTCRPRPPRRPRFVSSVIRAMSSASSLSRGREQLDLDLIRARVPVQIDRRNSEFASQRSPRTVRFTLRTDPDRNRPYGSVHAQSRSISRRRAVLGRHLATGPCGGRRLLRRPVRLEARGPDAAGRRRPVLPGDDRRRPRGRGRLGDGRRARDVDDLHRGRQRGRRRRARAGERRHRHHRALRHLRRRPDGDLRRPRGRGVQRLAGRRTTPAPRWSTRPAAGTSATSTPATWRARSASTAPSSAGSSTRWTSAAGRWRWCASPATATTWSRSTPACASATPTAGHLPASPTRSGGSSR